MKREGRQHGMVRTYRILPTPLNPRPETRLLNRVDTVPTAGLFARVSTRPTNHSKFTGYPAKPDKVKGSQKKKSNDVVTNYRLVTWRVVDARPGLNFSGVSATEILDLLSASYHAEDEYDHDPTVEIRDDDDDPTVESHDDAPVEDEEEMGFCDVGFVVEEVEGDDDWCLVAEIM